MLKVLSIMYRLVKTDHYCTKRYSGYVCPKTLDNFFLKRKF